jgi:CRP-like cAMP-binding protein
VKGDYLLKEHDETDNIYIVERGELEVVEEYEGNQFIIERLNSGTVLNYTTIFTDDLMKINIRASQHT